MGVKKLTKEQRQWLKDYKRHTTFQPMYMDELRAGSVSFDDVARESLNWFWDWMQETYSIISSDVPWGTPWGDGESEETKL